jgi:hypothetical protein
MTGFFKSANGMNKISSGGLTGGFGSEPDLAMRAKSHYLERGYFFSVVKL